MVTIQDIADRLEISKGTVSKALNDAPDISHTLKKQVLETAVSLGYRKLRRYKNPTHKLGIIVQSKHIQFEEPDHFAYDIIMGFRQMAEPAGYEVHVIPVDTVQQRDISYDAFVLQHDFSGTFILGFSLSEPWMKNFHTTKTPTVLYDNHVLSNPSVAYMGIDNEEGMALAIDHLKNMGHQKIGYLSGALGSHITQVRHHSFFQAMRSHGLKTNPTFAGCSYYLSECMNKHLPRLLRMGMTAIICSQDTLAASAIIRCEQEGFSVPRDVSIIGFDDIPLASHTIPTLTTVRQDRIQLGKSGFSALCGLMNGVPIGTVLLHAELITRNSTALPRTCFTSSSCAPSSTDTVRRRGNTSYLS